MTRLDDAAAVLGLPGKGDDTAGTVSDADTAALVMKEEWSRLARYVLQDALQTFLIFAASAFVSGRSSPSSYAATLAAAGDVLEALGGRPDLLDHCCTRAAAFSGVPPRDEPVYPPKLAGYF
jgi:hypothetical protein